MRSQIRHRLRAKRAFTIIELLVVVSIIALLIGLLLPAIGKARDTAKTTQSLANLRNLAAANATYEVDYSRHLTYSPDNMGQFGSVAAYDAAEDWPSIVLGYSNGVPIVVTTFYAEPIRFSATDVRGWHRFVNAHAINQYVNGKQYDPVFYAPKDTQVHEIAEERFDDPDNFTGGGILFSSYDYSAAALYAPDVFSRNGFQDPFSLPAGFRTPNSDQARYPDLKTHVMEHNWLQGKRVECNPFINGSVYFNFGAIQLLDCEPVWAHHTFLSTPMTLFYDGHVRGLGAREAFDASVRHATQVGYGLWSPDTPLGANGYLGNVYYGSDADAGMNSFHFLTTDGIKGRDTLGEG